MLLPNFYIFRRITFWLSVACMCTCRYIFLNVTFFSRDATDIQIYEKTQQRFLTIYIYTQRIIYSRRYNAGTWYGVPCMIRIKFVICRLRSARVQCIFWERKPETSASSGDEKKNEKNVGYIKIEFDSLALYIFSITSLACISMTTMALNFNRSSLLRLLRTASEYLSNAWFCFFLSFLNGSFEFAILQYEGKSNTTNWRSRNT